MPRPRFARLAPARQQRILQCAARAFADDGYDGASLNRIIETLGLNKGVFYYYFDGKADLFAAVLEMIWARFVPDEGFDVGGLDRDSFWPAIETRFRSGYDQVREEPWLVGLVRLLSGPPQTAGGDAAVRQLMARGQQWMKTLIERGQQVGAVRTDLPAELLLEIVAAADHAADRWLLGNWDRFDADERERLSFRIFELWRRLAAPPE